MPRHVHVYTSDDAWTSLLVMAGSRKFIQPLLVKLPDSAGRYVDARPDWMKQDLELLQAGRFPMWSYELPRYRHTIILSDRSRSLLFKISEWFVITNHLRVDSYYSEMSRVSSVLEAIGSKLLVVTIDGQPIETRHV